MRQRFASPLLDFLIRGVLGSGKYNRGAEPIKRLLTIFLIGAGLLTLGPEDALAQMPDSIKYIVWLSCASIIDGRDVNYAFAIDLDKQRVLQFEKQNMYYEMQDVRISENAIMFSYYTRGSHPFTQDEEFLQMVDKTRLNYPLEAYVSTSMEINRRNLSMRVIKRYYSTMLDHYEAKCSLMDAITPPSRQF
jgi:hypothetical protein